MECSHCMGGAIRRNEKKAVCELTDSTIRKRDQGLKYNIVETTLNMFYLMFINIEKRRKK